MKRGRLSIRTRLLLGIGLPLVIAITVVGVAFFRAMASTAADDWVDHTQGVLSAAGDAQISVNDLEARYEEYLLTGSEFARAASDIDVDSIQSQFQVLAEMTADNPAQVARWQAISAQVDALRATSLVPTMALRQQVDAGELTLSDVENVMRGGSAQRGFQTIQESIRAGIDAERMLLTERIQAADDADARLERLLITGATGTALLGVLAALLLSTSVGRSMERFARVAQAIAAGDLSQRVALKRTDEIGRAADAFDAMASALQTDIDERQRAQAATESLLNATAEGIYEIDTQGRVTMMNPACLRMTGYSLDELRGEHFHNKVHHKRADGSPYPVSECPTEQVLRIGETRHTKKEVFWRKDGTSFPVDYTAVPVRSDARVTGVVVSFHDISEQLKIDRMKDEFISIVSHELRTPLGSIRGSLGLLAAGVLGQLPQRGTHMLELAIRNTDRLIRLVSDILDIERIESGRAPIQLQPEDARELVVRSVESMAPAADAARIRLTCQAESLPLEVDPDRIQQALTNLVGNAIKFSEAGSEVSVSVRPDQKEALFSVHDEGRGIPADKLDKVFQRFEQVDVSDARQKGGTGLGLAITRSIVRQHGGRIWVESELGEGSTFYFTVPLTRAA